MAVALHFVERGAGKPVVLLHPVGLDHACWHKVASILARTHRVIAVDLRGHGQSPRLPGSTNIFDYAADVAALIERLDIGPCAVVGVSFGGMTATALAIARPDLVSTVVVSACPSSIPDDARAALRARGDQAMKEGMAAILPETLARWFSDGFQSGDAVEPYRRRLLADHPETWQDGWHTIAALDLGPRLSEIACPVLCIHAESDKGASLAALKATADGVQDGTLAVIKGAPHMVHIERAEEFAALVQAHLAEARA